MAKDPAFLFYANDWIGGTLGMTFEEKGAYIELLMLQFNRGHMTSHMIGHVLGHNSGQLWDTLKVKFIQDENGLYYNKRLEEEKFKRQIYSESRKNNVKGINQHTKKNEKSNTHISGNMTSHMIGHMENENENENDIEILKGGVGEKILTQVKELMEYFGFTEMRNPDKMKQAYTFLRILETDKRLDFFIEQFAAYKKYKEKSSEIKHSFAGYLGSIDERYLNGGWNARNWIAEKSKLNGTPGGIMKPNYALVGLITDEMKKDIFKDAWKDDVNQ